MDGPETVRRDTSPNIMSSELPSAAGRVSALVPSCRQQWWRGKSRSSPRQVHLVAPSFPARRFLQRTRRSLIFLWRSLLGNISSSSDLQNGHTGVSCFNTRSMQSKQKCFPQHLVKCASLCASKHRGHSRSLSSGSSSSKSVVSSAWFLSPMATTARSRARTRISHAP